ncbi:MAG: hypothetical protein ACKVJF_09120 [Flavobacteriales bacterium]
MKKVILCAAALMIGGVAFAQVSNSAGTAPSTLSAETNLSLDPLANTGTSIQTGDNQAVRIRQAGTIQSVLTDQSNGAGTGGNLARVRQTGNVSGNTAASGEANWATVLQSGTTNQSTTRQEGDFNNAFTDQDGESNKARIRQGTGQNAEDNFAAIEQSGTTNQALTQQTFDNSEAWTRQIGTDNKSRVLQNAGDDGTDGHSAFNHQEGDRNESWIQQDAVNPADGGNIAEALQIGDDNQAKQLQATSAPNGSPGNDGVINQGIPSPFNNFGDFPLLGQLYSELSLGSTPGGPSVGAKAKQLQYGEDNDAEIFQTLGSVGASNFAEQIQDVGSSGNDATIIQAHTVMGDPDNLSKQYQSGADNFAGMYVVGTGNKSLQDQRGDMNESYSSQEGFGNLLNVHQRGNENYGITMQDGSNNAALLVQYDGQSYTIDQNGSGNQSNILQMGPTGDFSAGEIPCDFDFDMDLDMDYTVPDFILDPVCDGC